MDEGVIGLSLNDLLRLRHKVWSRCRFSWLLHLYLKVLFNRSNNNYQPKSDCAHSSVGISVLKDCAL